MEKGMVSHCYSKVDFVVIRMFDNEWINIFRHLSFMSKHLNLLKNKAFRNDRNNVKWSISATKDRKSLKLLAFTYVLNQQVLSRKKLYSPRLTSSAI